MTLCARDLMQRDPMTVSADLPVLLVLHLFVVSQVSGAPIVDDRGRVVGIISKTDLLQIVDQVCDADIDALESVTADLPEQLDGIVAREAGTSEVVWVSPDAPISRVADLMRTEGVHRVLVGDPSHLLGIVTSFDMLRALEPVAERP